ncbi:iron chelate uptake ABC transporter family permease subunit [Nocardia crassostreae]|uniref:iron chelate uptake ABC transporter family permease subunit n=1 Tax=Nocardia crassostreae TaxID=53428 RepID=UPI0014721038|nr:iron chelate uptake ABC transporter family permease subunit [Nocardia crassostreae]
MTTFVSARLRTGALIACAIALTGCGAQSGPAADGAQAVTRANCGIDITVSGPPQRIYAAYQPAIEIAHALGVTDRLAGTAFLDSAVLPEYQDAQARSPYVEKLPSRDEMLAKNPDFVLSGFNGVFAKSAQNSIGTRASLHDLGVETWVLSPLCPSADGLADEAINPATVRFENVYADLRDLGALWGAGDRAEQVVAAFTDFRGTDTDRIVRYIRLPRTIAGLLAGIALALAGAVMQGLTRNPLAGPGLLGINAGASLAIVVAMGGLGLGTVMGFVWFAFLGAAVAAVFVYTLGSLGFGGATPVKLALAGAAFTALCGSITTAITLLDRGKFENFRFWVVGSLTRADLESVSGTAPFIVAGVVLAIAVARTLNTIAIGEDLARTLGARLAAVRAVGAVSVVVLAGAAVAIAGPIAFIGLVIPHMARAFAGHDYRWILAWCAVLGPALLLLADIRGRVMAQPQEIQVGIITAFAGSPFFLYLVRNRKVAKL